MHCWQERDEDGASVPVPGSGSRSTVAIASGWIPDVDGREFVGWLVRLVVPGRDG
ncbi:hypothetical protein GCM10010532_035920 [Dactylosporangium siamense]|uniref:Uncharacterized protein n=1 Tax=Dactylosporangium siamense TaxID=685454 RepID=A0A919PMI1_9ACTN|nr:hypothetical protein Dsi01nite_028340 [Dactylosporangium siamense]